MTKPTLSSRPATAGRRQFIAGVGAGLGMLALRGYAVEKPANCHFTHGVASGDPLADRVILWTRVLPGNGADQRLSVQWQVAKDQHFSQLVSSGVSSTNASRDYTVKVDASGLSPGNSYYYRFICAGNTSPVGRTRSLPAAGVSSLNLAVVSCSNYPHGYFHAYQEIAQRPFDAVLHLGDYIYEYEAGKYSDPELVAQGRGVEPSHEIVALEDYRMRYGLYRTDPALQAAHQAHPFICIWDDHEIADNTWQTGAYNHNDNEGSFSARRQAALQAYYEWIPIRENPAQGQEVSYRSFNFGNLASLIMLDTRLVGRDQQLSHEMAVADLKSALGNNKRTLLGPTQEQWLQQQLKLSSAAHIPWQILGQQVIMGKIGIPQIPDDELDPAHSEFIASGRYAQFRARGRDNLPLNLDAWDGYPAARNRLMADISQHANNTIVLAGDSHNAWVFELHDEADKPVAVEFASPSISSPGLEGLLPVSAERLENATLAVSPELKYFDSTARGWMELNIKADATVASFHYVSTVKDKNYQVIDGPQFETRRGDAKTTPI